jgi:hypothetical protein
MDSTSDRSPDPSRTNHDVSRPFLAHLLLHPIASPTSPPACRVSPHAGSGREPSRRSNHQELLGRQDIRSTRLERGIAERA